MAEARKYSDREVRAIIERALKGDPSEDAGLAHADLLAIGEQVGVSAEAMARAADEVRAAQLEQAATQSIAARRRRWLASHAAVFALINGLLFAVNAATTPGEWWVLFSVVFWGLGLALHAGLALGVSASRGALASERGRLESRRRARSSRLRVGPTDTASDENADLHEEQRTVAPKSAP